MGFSISNEAIAKILITIAVVGAISLTLLFVILRGHINLWRSKKQEHLATIIPFTWFAFFIFSYFIAYKVYPEFAQQSPLPIGGDFKEVESFVIIVTMITLLSCFHIAFLDKLKRTDGSPVLSKLALCSFAFSILFFPVSLLLAPRAIFKIERSEGRLYGKRFVWVAMAINLLIIACLKISASAFYFNDRVGWWVLALAGTAVVLWVVSLVFCLIAARYRPPVWVRWVSPLAALVLAIIIGFELPVQYFRIEHQTKAELINAQNGKIKDLDLTGDTEIQKVWCMAKTSAHFSDAGKLNSATLAKDQAIDGITYAGKTDIGFLDSGKVSEGILAKDTSIQGFPCAAGNKVAFNKSGSFNSCTLAQNHTMFGIDVPAKSVLKTDTEKNWETTPIVPFTFNGTTYAPGTSLQFYEGHLRFFSSTTDVTVQGIVCAMNSWCAFFPGSGKLQRCTLANKQVVNGLMLSGGQQIALYESGKLNIFKLTAESGVKGVRFEKDYFVFETEYPKLGQIKAHIWPGVKGVKLDPARGISLYESGSLESVSLVKDAKIAGIKYMGGESGTDIYWYESGKIKHARLAEAQTIQGIPCAKDSNVEFSPKGILGRAYLGKDAVIAGIKCAKDTETDIYETGALKIATLAEAQTIAGQPYAKGERLHFLKSGMVESTAAARDHYENFSQAANDDQALAAIEQAIAICPSYIEAREARLKIWLKKKDLKRAMNEIAAILQYDPGNLSAHVSSAAINETLGKADSAIADCNKALSIDPQCAVALKMRGDALMTQKKYSLALADLKKAVELSPDKESYLNSLAWALATCAESKYRNGQRAVELAEKSVRTGRNANNLDTLAATYAEVGRFDDAVKIQQEVIKVAPKNHPELQDFNKRLDWYRQKKPWRQ